MEEEEVLFIVEIIFLIIYFYYLYKFKEHTKETTFGMNFAPDTNHTDECVVIVKEYANKRVIDELEKIGDMFPDGFDDVRLGEIWVNIEKRIKELKQ